MTYYEFFLNTITFGGYSFWKLIREVEKKTNNR